jgi:protoheme IX farnesyltransferase
MIKKLSPFARYSWFVLIYNLLVVLWGAFVRASGSGAGCGAHWPLCNGVVVPREPRIETIIEFAHRLSSGLSLIFVVLLFIWAWRVYPKGHAVRLGAGLSLLFIITESLVGAMLVLFEWVALNQSIQRVVSVSIHLANTFMLLGSLLLTAWWASGGNLVQFDRQKRSILILILVGLAGILFLGVSGAITALGDTLFPSGTLAEGIQQDFAPTAHFLIRLRIWHPVIAIASSFYVTFVAAIIAGFSDDKLLKKLAWLLIGLFGVQLLAGLVNLVLLAPIWMQLTHLLLADLVWLSLAAFSLRLFKA